MMAMMPQQLTQTQLYGFTDWGTLHNLANQMSGHLAT